MKKTKIFAAIGGIGLFVLSVFLISADHVDSPNVSGTTSDIADFYAFEGENPSNTVFIATLQGILSPGIITENATFDEDVLVEFNIDNTGDFVEDLVIQAIKRGDSMYFFGPAAPVTTGLESNILTSANHYAVAISTVADTQTITENGLRFFAGPRRDAFYFDFNRFNDIASGNAAPGGFYPPGEAEDFFNNLNTLAIVVEVPNSLLGTPPEHILETEGGISSLPPSYNVWVSTKRKE